MAEAEELQEGVLLRYLWRHCSRTSYMCFLPLSQQAVMAHRHQAITEYQALLGQAVQFQSIQTQQATMY
jgi:hypothetical protein